MDLTALGVDQMVSLVRTPSKHPKPETPATSLPTVRKHRLLEWQSDDTSGTHSNPNYNAESDNLCSTCSLFAKHYDEVFEKDLYASHIYDRPLAEARSEAQSCALCKLICLSPLVQTETRDRAFGLYSVNIMGEQERVDATDYPPEVYSMGLTVSQGDLPKLDKRLHGMARLNHRVGREGLIVPAVTNPTNSHTSFLARLLDAEKADFGTVKSWLRDCEHSHEACKSHESAEGSHLTVIDCNSLDIVSKPTGESYVALSYVWGPPPANVSTRATPGKPLNVLDDAPRTIRDAIHVTLELGFRYLWIDRYCINQMNPEIKALQLAEMDKVYENAVITIVAAAGVDDRHGLPGSGTRPIVPRSEQPRAKVGKHTLVSLGQDIIQLVKRVKWATRGWTFQEGLLSKRCLVFGVDQMHYVCRTAYRCETLPLLPVTKKYDLVNELNISNVFDGEARIDRGDYQTLAKSFAHNVTNYLKRDLTFGSDALNAFRGIIARAPFESYYGVPLITRTGRELKRTGNAVRPVVIVSNEQNQALVATTPIDKSKIRPRYNMFGPGDFEAYFFDHLPGPGEPEEPSPLLAFLHGLAWNVPRARKFGDEENIAKTPPRRPEMPSWSWVSLQKAEVAFDSDPDGPKELKEDVLTIPYSDVRVWVRNLSAVGDDWIDFEAQWFSNKSQAIDECGPFLKIETRTAQVDSIIIPDFGAWDDNEQVLVTLKTGRKEEQYKVRLDCPHEAIPGYQQSQVGKCEGRDWKIMLVHRWNIYNPIRHECWDSWVTRNLCLVVEPSDKCWKRVGILSTHRNVLEGMERESLVLA